MSVTRSVPKYAILLHSPWMRSNGDAVGRILNSPDFVQCDRESERKGLTPVLADRFLTWSEDLVPKHELRDSDLHKHWHDLSHDHRYQGVLASSSNVLSFDDDDGGEAVPVSAPVHAHDIYLSESHVRTYATDRAEVPLVFEPEHQEVNAYWRTSSPKNDDRIPIGTIVFSTNGSAGKGWRSLASPHVSEAGPKRWHNYLLKVVGCWPEEGKMGDAKHRHDTFFDDPEAHTHGGGSASNSPSYDRVIDQSDDTQTGYAALTHHVHALRAEDIGPSSATQTGEADSRPYNVGVISFICVSDEAEFRKGMFLPLIPPEDFSESDVPDGWSILSAASIPGYPSSPTDRANIPPLHLRLVEPEIEKPFQFSSPFHTHEFEHSHTVVLSGSDYGTHQDADDDDVAAAADGHTHSFRLQDDEPVRSTQAPVMLKSREVTMIIFDG